MPDPTDHGPNPYVVDIEEATLQNETYRTTLWTGTNLQLTVMAIQPGHDIGLEVHEDHDQFLRVEEGTGRVQMGPAKERAVLRPHRHRRLGDPRAGWLLAQRDQRRHRAAQGLLAVRAAGASARHRPRDEGGGRQRPGRAALASWVNDRTAAVSEGYRRA